MTKQERIEDIINNPQNHRHDHDGLMDCCSIIDDILDKELLNCHPMTGKIEEKVLEAATLPYREAVSDSLFNRIKDITFSHNWEVYYIYISDDEEFKKYYAKCSKCSCLRWFTLYPVDVFINSIKKYSERDLTEYYERLLTCDEEIIRNIIK